MMEEEEDGWSGKRKRNGNGRGKERGGEKGREKSEEERFVSENIYKINKESAAC